MLDVAGQELKARLLEVFRGPIDRPMPDAEFDDLALRIFACQLARNGPFAAYCARRGATPDTVSGWVDIPAVPAAAFREVDLVAGPSSAQEAVFRTSGTTRGSDRRGVHRIPDLDLYHAALLPAFRAFLLPDDQALPLLSLIPAPEEMADSSLAHMVGVVVRRLGGPGSGWFATVADGIDEARLADTLRRAIDEGRPVCLLGTSFSFVHWTDRLHERNERFALPAGSRLMDTGGFKGRSREVGAAELRATYLARLGIPADHCINEYGMTELLSQCYDAALRDRVRMGAPGPERKVGPPWLRTTVVDPATLAPLPHGRTGLLRHCDLANLGSVIAVQTEDLGVAVTGGFRVFGRAGTAPPRGCSIAMDELLSAVGERRT